MGTSGTESCEGCPQTQFKHIPPQPALKLSPVMEVSSVSSRVPPPPPEQLRSGMIFCAKSPTLGDKLLSNFPRGRGRGGAMGRGSFHAKVLVLFIKNGS